MANRMWSLDFLSRRGSSQLSEEEASTLARKASSRVQTLCNMRQKSNSTVSVASDNADSADDGQNPASNGSTASGGANSALAISANSRLSSSNGTSNSGKSTPKPLLIPNNNSSGSCATDSSTGKDNPLSAGTATLQPGAVAAAPAGPSPSPPSAAAATPAAAPAAAGDNGASEYNSDSSTFSSSASGSTGNFSSRDEGRDSLEAAANGVAHQTPAAAANPQQLVQSSLLYSSSKHPHHQQQQQPPPPPGSAFGAGPATPQVAGGGAFNMPQQQHAMMQHSGNASASLAAAAAAAAGGVSGSGSAAGQLEMLLGELRREAGLSEEQAASAASLLQRFSALSAGGGSSSSTAPNALVIPSTPAMPSLLGDWGPSPTTPPMGPAEMSGNSAAAFLQATGATPASNLAANMAAAAAAGVFGPAGMQFGNMGGFEQTFSGQNAGSADNLLLQQQQSASGSEGAGGSASAGVSGSEFVGMPGLVSGLTSSEAVYGTDGLDAPGTAQVAVHNVPFKWCNADLEALFRQLPGYLDAQLLFHENGRSKGVGVALFGDAACAHEACEQLSGVQADGRKLELVLMSPDNHISFSCKQVAVLGLPWEYTAADVRALIEAAAEADGALASEAGVEAVEVAYREDGKSEGRAIATFRSRASAHAAITRLHGRETLAGLRMRLFYLHEQQQRQHLLSQNPQALITSVGQLSLDSPSPAVAAAAAAHAHHGAAAPNNNAGGLLTGGGDAAGSNSSRGVMQQQLGGVGDGAGQLQQQQQGSEGNSQRSSFDKDQGPVILHVSGLMESVTREQLRELFSQAGEVTKVDIPDGGRSMGYGFITFSNPQAAEQAMLLFNNYPLSGGAIHVAYSTSATAKARQQALRQARKATLGGHAGSAAAGGGRNSLDLSRGLGVSPGGINSSGSSFTGGSGFGAQGFGGKPGFGGVAAAAGLGGFGGGLGGRRGPGGGGFDDPLGLGSLGAGGFGGGGLDALGGGGLGGMGPARHSFDHPGFASRSRASSHTGAGLLGSAGNLSMANAQRRLSFGPGGAPGGFGAGLSMAQLHQLQVLQASGNPAAAAAAAAVMAGAGAPGMGTPGSSPLPDVPGLDHLMMQLGASGADPAGFGGLGGGPPQGFGAQPGTPPRGGFGGGWFGASMPPAGAGRGLGLGMGGAGFGSNAAAAAGLLGPGAGGFGGQPLPPPNGGDAFGLGGAAVGQQANKHVLVTGLPSGIDERQLTELFQLCGVVEHVRAPGENDVAIVTYESKDAATQAVRMMDGTSMPSGRTMHVTFAPLAARADLAPAGPTGETNTVNNMPFATAGFGAGAGLDLFGRDAAAAAMAAGSLPSGMFGQAWNGNGAAARPPFAGMFGAGDMHNNSRASWDGSGIAAANAAAGRPPMPGMCGPGRHQQQQQQFGVTGRHSISGPPSGSLRAVSPVGGMAPAYMASPVPSMPGGGGGANGVMASPGGNLFARPGSVGNGVGGDNSAALLRGGNGADLSPFGLQSGGGIGGLGAEYGYGSAGAAVDSALLELSEEASRMQQQQGNMGAVSPAGMPSAWGSLSGWSGGMMSSGKNAAGLAAGVGTSEGQGSSRSSSVAGGGSHGRLAAMNESANGGGGGFDGGVNAATAGSDGSLSAVGPS